MTTILMQIAYAMLPLSAQLKDFWVRRLASIQDQKFISKSQQSITSVWWTVDHVKFLMHLRLYGMLRHNHWGIDDWAPFAKY